MSNQIKYHDAYTVNLLNPFKKYYLPFFLLIIFTTLYSQNKPSSTMENQNQTEETKVIAIVRQLADLMIKKDTVEMDKILDEHYTLTHMTGYVQPKSEWFSEVVKESMKYYSAKEVDHKVIINGNKADVTVQNLVDARIWGSRHTWRLQQKLQMEKRGDKWIILKSVASTF